jgi:hypothetical protein
MWVSKIKAKMKKVMQECPDKAESLEITTCETIYEKWNGNIYKC